MFIIVRFNLIEDPVYFLAVSLLLAVIVTEFIQEFALKPTSEKIYRYYFEHMTRNIVED